MNRDENHAPTLALIGGGRMGRALIDGMTRAAVVRPEQISVSEPDEKSRAWWQENHPLCRVFPDSAQAVEQAEVVIVAVKPDVVERVATSAKKDWKSRLVMSVAAGISLEKLSRWFSSERIIRVMPNTPCLAGAGASAYCCGAGVTSIDKRRAGEMLAAVGWAGEVSEKQMDAITGLSGSGPAYVCVAIEALADGGVMAGLPRELALRLATQTVLGTAKMVLETGQHPAALKDAVASPGGTTIAGLRALEKGAFRAALIEAVVAATQRSRELGS